MNRQLTTGLIVLFGLVLAACSSTAPANTAPASNAPALVSGADLTQTKEEAAVTVKVTPLNLQDPSAGTLDFKITLDTHSVDLSYDLTAIATLSSDAGEEVKPAKWDGPGGGGHHKEGVLSFPALENRGQALTLVLRGIADVPERTFVWDVTD
ncbi:MAG TPA: hypothetical protein VIK33_01135 [Anaerolineae bacterium]